MKYAITVAAGHISKPLTEQLLKAGHQVTTIGRNEEHLKELVKADAPLYYRAKPLSGFVIGKEL
jgi:putative NADH-flavin reductase